MVYVYPITGDVDPDKRNAKVYKNLEYGYVLKICCTYID